MGSVATQHVASTASSSQPRRLLFPKLPAPRALPASLIRGRIFKHAPWAKKDAINHDLEICVPRGQACHGSKRSRTDGRRADAAGAGEASGQRRIQAGRLCRGASGDSFKEPPCTLSGHSLAPLVNVAAQRGEACFLALWVAMTLRDSVGARALARVLDCACSITRARYKSAETTTSCAQIAQVLRIRKWPPCTI